MIQCRIVYNEFCLKCRVVEGKMVRIGAFVMCQRCFEEEFNTEEIDIESETGKNYYKWLKVYKGK